MRANVKGSVRARVAAGADANPGFSVSWGASADQSTVWRMCISLNESGNVERSVSAGMSGNVSTSVNVILIPSADSFVDLGAFSGGLCQ